MGSEDKRNRLADDVFSYRVSKDDKVFISWHGKQVMILKDEQARKLITQLEDADPHQVQMLLAKITGNFKRGNER